MESAPQEPTWCPGCGAVCEQGRWSNDSKIRKHVGESPTPIAVRICPVCRQDPSGVPHGYLHVDGEFCREHREELDALLHQEARRARVDSPLNQVLGWADDGTGGLLVTTSTEHLAQRLGRALEDTYDGEVLYGYSDENNMARV